MKYNYFYLIALLLVTSCNDTPIEFDDNTRLIILGKVNYDGKKSLSNTNAIAYSSGDFGSALLGTGGIDEDNFVRIRVLSAKNAPDISVRINSTNALGYQPDITSYFIRGITFVQQENQTITLPPLDINDVIEAKLIAIRKTNTVDTLKYTGLFMNPRIELNVNANGESLIKEDFEVIRGFIRPDNSREVRNFNIIKNDSLKFNYELINNGINESGEIVIPFDAKTASYVFEY